MLDTSVLLFPLRGFELLTKPLSYCYDNVVVEIKLLYIQKNRAPLTLKYMSDYLFACVFYNTKAPTMVNCFNIPIRSPDTEEIKPNSLPSWGKPMPEHHCSRVQRKRSKLIPGFTFISTRGVTFIFPWSSLCYHMGGYQQRLPLQLGWMMLHRAEQQWHLRLAASTAKFHRFVILKGFKALPQGPMMIQAG